MNLITNLATFTIITFSPQIEEEEANKLTSLAHEIVRLYSTLKNQYFSILHERALEKERKAKERKQKAKEKAAKQKGQLVSNPDESETEPEPKKKKGPKVYQVTAKVHHLTHYGELVKQFGPLFNYSALRWERKHQFPKKVARMMKCFRNPSFTISTRHQFLRALTDRDNDFKNVDYYDSEAHLIGFTSLSSLKTDLVPLKKAQYPFKLPNGIHVLRRKRFDRRNNMWIHVKGFFQHTTSQEIYCSGDVFRIPNGIDNKHPLNGLQKLNRISRDQCILVSNLGFANDYMHQTEELNGRKNIVNNWLLRWLL